MKEGLKIKFKLSEVDPLEYDRVVYPQLVMGHMVGQKDMISDDIGFAMNPEKYPPAPEEEPKKEKPKRHPLQGEFLLPQPFTITGFKVFMCPMTSDISKAYQQAQSVRGGSPRGRRT